MTMGNIWVIFEMNQEIFPGNLKLFRYIFFFFNYKVAEG